MLRHFKNYSQDPLFYVITLPLGSYMFQKIINFSVLKVLKNRNVLY